jgi:hypothetical protein
MHYVDESLGYSFDLPDGWQQVPHNLPLTFLGPHGRIGVPSEVIEIEIGAVLPQYLEASSRERYMAEPGTTTRRATLGDETNVVVLIRPQNLEISAVHDGVQYAIMHARDAATMGAMDLLGSTFRFPPRDRAIAAIRSWNDPQKQAMSRALKAETPEEARQILASAGMPSAIQRPGYTFHEIPPSTIQRLGDTVPGSLPHPMLRSDAVPPPRYSKLAMAGLGGVVACLTVILLSLTVYPGLRDSRAFNLTRVYGVCGAVGLVAGLLTGRVSQSRLSLGLGFLGLSLGIAWFFHLLDLWLLMPGLSTSSTSLESLEHRFLFLFYNRVIPADLVLLLLPVIAAVLSAYLGNLLTQWARHPGQDAIPVPGFATTTIILLSSAVIWSGFGFIATTGSIRIDHHRAVSPSIQKQQIEAYDRGILRAGMIAWAVAGSLVGWLLSETLLRRPRQEHYQVVSNASLHPLTDAQRRTMPVAILLGAGAGLFFPLWYFPRLDVTGTGAAFAVELSILLCLLLGALAGISTLTVPFRVVRVITGREFWEQ